MKFIKHSFEAVSLLTTRGGMLDVSIVPAIGQPDWIIPTAMILSIDDYDERIWTYLWHNQDISVYHLMPKDTKPEKLIILEGNSVVHRIALQICGDIRTKSLRISDMIDINLSDDNSSDQQSHNEQGTDMPASPSINSDEPSVQTVVDNDQQTWPFVFQMVKLKGEDDVYIVPDLEGIAHQLVDLDS